MNLDFSDIKVLLIGDFMIDHYIIGTSNRMSPEAPVQVVTPKKDYSIPGGAGNVAMNLCLMGADVTCVGYVGDDSWGKKLLSILENKGINIDEEYMEIVDNHPTTLKQRIYLNGKQFARLDTEEYYQQKLKSMFYLTVNRIYKDYDIIILSDYNKGVFGASLQEEYFNISDLNKKVIVDPKVYNWPNNFRNATIITPNLNELESVIKNYWSFSNTSPRNSLIDDDQSLIEVCNEIIREWNYNYIVAKKGDKGMTIVGKNNFVKHIKAHPVENPDVTGAGDTVIAALSLAYAKTNDIELSAKIANAAAAIVVGKTGTATATIKEIKELLSE